MLHAEGRLAEEGGWKTAKRDLYPADLARSLRVS